MKTFAKVVGGIVACFILFSVAVSSAELSDLEQNALHTEAAKLAKDIGLSEDVMYKNLVFLYLAKQSQRAAEHTSNPVEAKHQRLRARLYETTANALLKVAFTTKVGNELLADLQKEQKMTGGTVVSPKLSKRLNAFGNAAADALLTATRMSGQMVELASFEAAQECGTKKAGYAMQCLEGLQEAVRGIEAAMTILENMAKPFASAAMLGGAKQFTY